MSETPAGYGDLLTIPDAAARLRVSESTVWRWVHGGKLPSVKLGKARRIRAESLERFIEKGEEVLTGEASSAFLKPFTFDNTLWKTMGMFSSGESDVSANVDHYIGEAIAAHKLGTRAPERERVGKESAPAVRSGKRPVTAAKPSKGRPHATNRTRSTPSR